MIFFARSVFSVATDSLACNIKSSSESGEYVPWFYCGQVSCRLRNQLSQPWFRSVQVLGAAKKDLDKLTCTYYITHHLMEYVFLKM